MWRTVRENDIRQSQRLCRLAFSLGRSVHPDWQTDPLLDSAARIRVRIVWYKLCEVFKVQWYFDLRSVNRLIYSNSLAISVSFVCSTLLLYLKKKLYFNINSYVVSISLYENINEVTFYKCDFVRIELKVVFLSLGNMKLSLYTNNILQIRLVVPEISAIKQTNNLLALLYQYR